MRRLPGEPLLAALTAIVSMATAPPPADPPRSDEPQTVTVTAAPDIDRQVKDFVGSLAPHTNEQMSLLAAIFCPIVQGLAASDAAAVEARLRTVASAVGVKVGDSRCRPNMLLIVTADKRAFIQALATRKPDYLGNLDPAPLRALLRTPGYAAAWQIGGTVADSGQVLTDVSNDIPIRTTTSASRIGEPVRPVFDVAVVVVEARGLAGLTRNQLADYAAMRLLSGADPKRAEAASAPTVLKVLDAPANAVVPAGLTAWDVGFLRGLYSARSFVNGPAQRSDIKRAVRAGVGQARDGQ